MKKLRVGILFGGRSGEHEVSLLSAASVLNAIDRNKFEVVPIGITKEGRWLTAARRGGAATLCSRPRPGAISMLTPAQRRLIIAEGSLGACSD